MSRMGCWLPLAGAILVVVGCGGTDVGSRWLTGGVIVDGDTDEWSGPGLTCVDELPGAVGAANNDTSLYVMVRFADPNMGRRITVGGATVWWNRDGREKKDIGIRFAPLIDMSHPPEQRGGPETRRTDGQGPGVGRRIGGPHARATGNRRGLCTI